MKKILFTMLALVLMVGLALPMALPAAANGGPTKDYGDVTINQWQDGNFPEIWDLTKCDLTLSYMLDMSGIATPGWVLTEVGLREVGGPNLDPNYQGGWLESVYKSSTSNDNLANVNDYHVLMLSRLTGMVLTQLRKRTGITKTVLRTTQGACTMLRFSITPTVQPKV